MGTIGKVRQGLIDNDAVTSAAISAFAITSIKIAPQAVTTDKITLSSIDSDNIISNSIVARHITTQSVGADKIANLSISTAKISPSAITTNLIAASAVENRHLGLSAVTWDKVAPNAIRTVNIQPLSITTDLISNTAVDTRHINVSAVTWEKVAANAIRIQNIDDSLSKGLGYRNCLINGHMIVWQRSLSGVAGVATPAYNSADRWFCTQSGSNTQVSTSRFSVSSYQPGLSGFQSAIRWGRPGGAVATGVTTLGQVVESVNSIPYENLPATLSFFARIGTNFSALGGALRVRIITGRGEDETATNMLNSTWAGFAESVDVNIVPTTTWARYSVSTYIRPDITQLGVALSWTPNGVAGVDDNIYLTGIQLEPNPVPTAYEFRRFSTELNFCQRYFEKTLDPRFRIGTGNANGELRIYQPGITNATHSALLSVRYNALKRVSPTFRVFSPGTGAVDQMHNYATLTDVAAAYSNVGQTGAIATANVAVAANILNVGAHFTAEAEL